MGGKWTTFRGFAEEVADTLLARLGQARRRSTRDLPIGGGRGFPADRGDWLSEAARDTGVPEGRLDTLLARYGTTARAVARHEADAEPGGLSDATDYSRAEIDWIVRNERVVHLADIVMRRTTLAITGALTARDLAAIAGIAAAALGWTDARTTAEIAFAAAVLAERNRLVLDSPFAAPVPGARHRTISEPAREDAP